jgi:hypothetical protein
LRHNRFPPNDEFPLPTALDAFPSRPGCFRLDAKIVLVGIVLPGLCFIVDCLNGEWITSLAPAGLFTLYGLGVGSLALSSRLDPQSRSWSVVSGALAAASLTVCLIAVPLSLLALGAARSVLSLWFSSVDLYSLGLSTLGLSTLWTAWVFVRRTYFVVRTGLRVQGPLRTLGLGLLGATFLFGATYGADRLDRWWVASQIQQISRSSPDEWPPILAKLSAYPLCGRERCSKLVCDRLFLEFGSDAAEGGLYYPPQVPPEHEELLAKFLRGPTSQRCRRMD